MSETPDDADRAAQQLVAAFDDSLPVAADLVRMLTARVDGPGMALVALQCASVLILSAHKHGDSGVIDRAFLEGAALSLRACHGGQQALIAKLLGGTPDPSAN